MSKYTAEKLVSISLYQNYFPKLPDEIKQDCYKRIAELIEEENDYCDKGNFKHMAQIFTSIALYEILQKHGKSEEEAYKIVSEEMWAFLDPSKMQQMAKKSYFLPLMKKIVPFGFKKGSGYGSLPYTDFIRTKTLCQGGDCCDFKFIRHESDAGDGWERSKSI